MDCERQGREMGEPVAMTVIYDAWYNFVRLHSTLRTTPAVAAGIVHEPWTLERLLTESANTMAARSIG
jgi:hypothetical protein